MPWVRPDSVLICENTLLDISLKLNCNNATKRQWVWSTYFDAFAFELKANALKLNVN